MSNPHDDRLNRLEQWLEEYGNNEVVVRFVREMIKMDVQDTAHPVLNGALRDLANIVGVGLEDLEGP